MSNTNPQITHLNGFLEGVACLNSFTNDGKTYYVELLDKINDSVQDTLRAHFQVKQWTFTPITIEQNWKEVFMQELQQYFFQYISEVLRQNNKEEYDHLLMNDAKVIQDKFQNIYDDLHSKYILEYFIKQLSEIIPADSMFKKVEVEWFKYEESWYECYSDDYIFETKDQILFLHFGSSD